MADWRVEIAPRASACHECTGPIRKGEHRFGARSPKPKWFHLRCAKRGAPVVFRPFEAKVQALLAQAKRPGESLAADDRPFADALGEGSLEVLADRLQTRGDPWGELIALRLAKKHAAAIELYDSNEASFTGDLRASELFWRDGVIAAAVVEGRELASKLEELLSLRTASRLETLVVRGELTAEVASLLNRHAPKTFTHLWVRGRLTGLAGLELPQLDRLTVHTSANQLGGLFTCRLPSLRELRLTARPALTTAFLSELLEWPTFARLRRLDFEDDTTAYPTLDRAGLVWLTERAQALKHLKVVWLELAGRDLDAKDLTAAKAAFAARTTKAVAEDERRRKERFDRFDLTTPFAPIGPRA